MNGCVCAFVSLCECADARASVHVTVGVLLIAELHYLQSNNDWKIEM